MRIAHALVPNLVEWRLESLCAAGGIRPNGMLSAPPNGSRVSGRQAEPEGAEPGRAEPDTHTQSQIPSNPPRPGSVDSDPGSPKVHACRDSCPNFDG
jgi:hypothetical protein